MRAEARTLQRSELFGGGEFLDKCGGGLGVDVPGGTGGGIAEFEAQVADFGGGVGEQAGDLGFKGAGVDDLAEGGVGGQREQVAGYIEGAGLEGALVGFRLEGFRTGNAAAEGLKDGRGGALVGGEKVVDGLGVEVGGGGGNYGVLAEIGEIPAGFEEVLVAGGALLAVPALLVDEDDGGQEAEALDGESDVGQIGDGAVAVLEVEGVEELLGALGADFSEGLAHRQGGAGVFGHGVGQHFGVGAVNGGTSRRGSGIGLIGISMKRE